jgi:peptidylprolyl isomerase
MNVRGGQSGRPSSSHLRHTPARAALLSCDGVLLEGLSYMKLLLIAAACVAAFAFTACNGDDDDPGAESTRAGGAATPGATSAAGTTPTAGDGTPQTQPTTATGENPTPGGSSLSYAAPPPMTIDENKRYFATIKTDAGDIRLELFPSEAPIHVNNFVFLAREGFYNGVTFHRVIPGFVAQAGDPTGTGRGGPGYTIEDEQTDRQFIDGTLGMAKTAAPNSAGSQWFICYAPQPNLDGGYTAFGQLVEGRDVLDAIAPRDPATATTPGTVINSIEIEEQDA